jgi:hypothetical protein
MQSARNEQEQIAWLGLREIYRLLGTPDGNSVVRTLLRYKAMKATELMKESQVADPKFYLIMRALVMCQVVDRKVHSDRSVSYSISAFGMNVLELSEPILDKIKEKMKDKESLLLSAVQRRMS